MYQNNHENLPYILALIGRVIFGIGRWSMIVCKQASISYWFIGQDFGLALGIVVSITTSATFLNYYLTPEFTKVGLGFACMMGTLLCFCSFISGIIFTLFQKHNDNILAKQFINKNDAKVKFRWSSLKRIDLRFWVLWSIIVWHYISWNYFPIISRYYFVQIS